MINIDFKNSTYECPFCNKTQAFSRDNCDETEAGYSISFRNRSDIKDEDIIVYHLKCNNKNCDRMTVVAKSRKFDRQWDLIPENVCREFPDYIPEQIRNDYKEACIILDKSPKAAATLLRRCLQGMIHDFWNIKEKNLNAEITSLKEKITSSQWKAIDGLRSIGNIGAHMEKDVNLIVDICSSEALQLKKLIELLLEKWYIARHEEEQLYEDIVGLAEIKEEERKVVKKDEGVVNND